MPMSTFLLMSAASAQTFTTEATGVITAQAGTITANGVGSPTVAWDAGMQRYVMFFETQLGAPAGDCPVGTWGIGAASSDDGVSWEVYPDPVVSPTTNTPYRCVAAHPSVTVADGAYHLYFKAEQGNNACASGNKPWGCSNYTGIGHAVVAPDLDDFTVEIAELEAEISVVEADRDAALDGFATELSDYRTLLTDNQSEFSCNAASPVCTPCGAVTVTGTRAAPGQVDFCQGFAFGIPGSVVVGNGGQGNHFFSLVITPEVGSVFTCFYRKSGGQYVLDLTNAAGVNAVCTNGATAGTSVTATRVELGVSPLSGNNPVVGVQLTATNLADQEFTGGVFETLDTVEADLLADDYAATVAHLPNLLSDLADLYLWLTGFPTDPEKALMATETSAFGALALNLYDDLNAWADELVVLEADLQVYLDYTPSVSVALTDGLSAQLNTVFGYPSVMKIGGQWVMMVQQYPNLRRATATAPEGPFTLDAGVAVAAGQVSWVMSEVYDPNLVCQGGPVPYQSWFGGRTQSGPTVTDAGISDAVSSNAVTWLANIASRYFSWADSTSYRHFDLIRSTTGQYRMWYAEKVGGKNQISVTSTTAAFPDAQSTQRVCP